MRLWLWSDYKRQNDEPTRCFYFSPNVMWPHWYGATCFPLGKWKMCRGTFVLAFCSCGILRRINTAVFGVWETIFAKKKKKKKELCHVRPSNRPLTSCLPRRYLAGYLCHWVAGLATWRLPVGQTESAAARDNDGDRAVPCLAQVQVCAK